VRLHPQELAYIANHARDRYLIVDDVLLPVYESFRAQVNSSACLWAVLRPAVPAGARKLRGSSERGG